MTEPRLTICIPHKDRTDMLQHAIDSCLSQTTPVKVVVSDQGKTEKTAALMDRYRDHPHVRHVRTPDHVNSLWRNWKFALEQAETPFVAWLQDDDCLSRAYASRVCAAFDAFPEALHWQARCYCASPDRQHGVWWGTNGPQCGLRMMDMGQELWPGGYLLASMYLTAWALSPGVAFRRGPELQLALDGMPDGGCDLFAERLILAAMGAQGPWVADPITAGYWIQHGKNEHHNQHVDGSMPGQVETFIRHLDSILDGFPTWDGYLFQWLLTRAPSEIIGWMNHWACKGSRYSDAVLNVLARSLEGRAVAVTPEQAAAMGMPEPCAIYDEAEAVAA